jgi:hypothetical protein
MTEAEWLNRAQLVAMLEHVHRAGCSERKLQLAAIAFCRHVSHLPFPVEWHDTVARFEEWVEGAATAEQVSAARQRLEAITETSHYRDEIRSFAFDRFHGDRAATFLVDTGVGRHPFVKQLLMVKEVAWNANRGFGVGQERTIREAHCRIVREIFGNPFRPVTHDPAWRTSTVLALAQQIYDSRDFSPMPILADALQDAGCDNEEILKHCRQPGEHVRGCWCVDHCLGKE